MDDTPNIGTIFGNILLTVSAVILGLLTRLVNLPEEFAIFVVKLSVYNNRGKRPLIRLVVSKLPKALKLATNLSC